MNYRGYTIRTPDTGGKAGYGRNKTSTVQVLYDRTLEKQIRFTVGDKESLRRATLKAMHHIDALVTSEMI